ncbi:MAG: STAS domain-containing protein [Candidatus Omnitrophica bacterium]|nr:STAS domain-containing protein [Candidatus Omnitrophota bacterium]
MKIQQKQKDDIQVFELDGELDFHTSPDLREKISAEVSKQNHKVVVNLKNVSYIDSSGLATFVEALQKAKRASGKFILAELAPAVKSVFEIAKLDKVFSLAGTEEDACRLAKA